MKYKNKWLRKGHAIGGKLLFLSKEIRANWSGKTVCLHWRENHCRIDGGREELQNLKFLARFLLQKTHLSTLSHSPNAPRSGNLLKKAKKSTFLTWPSAQRNPGL